MAVHFSHRRYFWGGLFVVIGVLLLLDTLTIIEFGDFVRKFWPLVLVLIGIKLIISGGITRHKFGAGDVDSVESVSKINMKHTFGDVRVKLDSKEFMGGIISNVFGNIEVDMEELSVKEGIYHLELRGVFGDLVIIMPKQAQVSLSASTSFGTVRIKDRSSSGISGHLDYTSDGYHEADCKLSIDAHQSFGDIKVF